MSEPHGTLPGFGTDPTTTPPSSAAPVDPAGTATTPADPVVTTDPAATPAGDEFDRSRVLRLIERLERDVATVEAAMSHVEAGEHEAYAAAVATLEPRLAD